MMNLNDAKISVEKELEKKMVSHDHVEPVIMDSETIEEIGVGYFSTRTKNTWKQAMRFILLRVMRPFIVNRHTGEIIETGTAIPIEEYICKYEEKLNHEKT